MCFLTDTINMSYKNLFAAYMKMLWIPPCPEKSKNWLFTGNTNKGGFNNERKGLKNQHPEFTGHTGKGIGWVLPVVGRTQLISPLGQSYSSGILVQWLQHQFQQSDSWNQSNNLPSPPSQPNIQNMTPSTCQLGLKHLNFMLKPKSLDSERWSFAMPRYACAHNFLRSLSACLSSFMPLRASLLCPD